MAQKIADIQMNRRAFLAGVPLVGVSCATGFAASVGTGGQAASGTSPLVGTGGQATRVSTGGQAASGTVAASGTMGPMSRPTLSAKYGFAPETPEVTPVRGGRPGEGLGEIKLPIRFEGELILDFGRKLTGRVWIEIDGPVDYVYASDPQQLERIIAHADKPGFCYDSPPSYIRAEPRGSVAPSGGKPVMIEDTLSALRLLRLKSAGPVTLRRCWVQFSSPHLPLAGSFACNDAELERFWHMDVYTTLLCTQNNLDAMVPVPAPGGGFVSWDGARRDREVWGGDLRLASLTWLGAYDNAEPIRNSLFMLWQGRHVECSEFGMVPGSGSTHQTFFEWTFWFLVNAWEYYLRTADRDLLASFMGPLGLDKTLEWVKRKGNARGFVEATNSWMYVYKVSGEMTALAIVQVAGLEAMANFFDVGSRPELAREARAMAVKARSLIPERFFDKQMGGMRMLSIDNPLRTHYSIDANAWAVIYGLGDANMRQSCLRFLNRPELQTPVGLRCLFPVFDEKDGDWALWPNWKWVHNTTVWPYPNCYAALARIVSGDMAGGLETLKAFHRPIDQRGHATIWEAMTPEGGLPFGPDGNTLSFCHGWGGAGAHILQQYVLGISPEAPGFAKIGVNPDLGPLDRASGTIPTPKGPIRIELEKTAAGFKGKLVLPTGIEAAKVPAGVEVKQSS